MQTERLFYATPALVQAICHNLGCELHNMKVRIPFFFGLFWKSVELLSMLSRNMKLGNSLVNNLPLALIYNAVIANTITLVVIYLSNLLEILYLQFIQDEAVQKVVEFMDTYSLSQEDFDTIVEISKFKVGNYSRSRLMFILSNVMFTWPSLTNYFCIDSFQFRGLLNLQHPFYCWQYIIF